MRGRSQCLLLLDVTDIEQETTDPQRIGVPLGLGLYTVPAVLICLTRFEHSQALNKTLPLDTQAGEAQAKLISICRVNDRQPISQEHTANSG